MMKNFKPAYPATISRTTIEFGYIDDENSGYVFDCDEDGHVTFGCEAARKNYEYCLAHPELFSIYNERITRDTHYIEPPTGTCTCGTHITLHNEYRGACECPTCGRWYNLFGQSLIDPEGWEDDDYEY